METREGWSHFEDMRLSRLLRMESWVHREEMFNPEGTAKIILIKGSDLVNVARFRKTQMIIWRINITF